MLKGQFLLGCVIGIVEQDEVVVGGKVMFGLSGDDDDFVGLKCEGLVVDKQCFGVFDYDVDYVVVGVYCVGFEVCWNELCEC